MLKITDLNLTLPPEVKTYMLADLRPYNAYVNGERSNTLAGYAYEIVLPEMKYEKLNVKVPIECQPLPILNIDEDPLPVGEPLKIVGLELRSYFSKGTINITASATQVSLQAVPSAKGA